MVKPASGDIVDVTITLDLKAGQDRLNEVFRQLQARGLTDAVLRARLGIVNGSVPADKEAGLGEVPGVVKVRRDRTYRAS
jgi:hypothetical protein